MLSLLRHPELEIRKVLSQPPTNLAVKGHMLEGSWQRAGTISANDTERLPASSIVMEDMSSYQNF